jgi:hypothetical protein
VQNKNSKLFSYATQSISYALPISPISSYARDNFNVMFIIQEKRHVYIQASICKWVCVQNGPKPNIVARPRCLFTYPPTLYQLNLFVNISRRAGQPCKTKTMAASFDNNMAIFKYTRAGYILLTAGTALVTSQMGALLTTLVCFHI